MRKSYRKLNAISEMRRKVCDFLHSIYGDNLIVWDGKKEFIWKGDPLKIKITYSNNGIPVTEKRTVTFNKHGKLEWGKA